MKKARRRPSPLSVFLTSMAELHEAQRKRDIERNRERLRMQAWPQPKRPAGSLIQAEAALRVRRDEAVDARGNLIGHMLGYSHARESNGLPRWCADAQQWDGKLLDHIVVHRRPGTTGTPTPGSSFVVTEPYLSDRDHKILSIWQRGLAPYGLCVMRLPEDWRTHNPSDDLSKVFLIASQDMMFRISEFERVHRYIKPLKTKPTPDMPPDMSNVLNIMSRRVA